MKLIFKNPFQEVTNQDSLENIKNSKEKKRNPSFQAKFLAKILHEQDLPLLLYIEGKKKTKKKKNGKNKMIQRKCAQFFLIIIF